MNFLICMVVGLISGWLTRLVLRERGAGPIFGGVIAIVGALGGILLMRLENPAIVVGLVFSSLTALLGAAVLTGAVALAANHFGLLR